MKFNTMKGPHISQGITSRKIMVNLMLALVFVALFGMVSISKLGAESVLQNTITTFVASSVVAIIVDAIFYAIKNKGKGVLEDVRNSYSFVTTLIITMIFPLEVPLQTIVIATFIAQITKILFGGFGKNIINPAAAARVAAMILGLSLGGFGTPVDGLATATPLTVMMQTGFVLPQAYLAEIGGVSALAAGSYPGLISETSSIAIILAAAFLVFKKVIDWRMPAYFIGTMFIVSLLVAVGINGVNPFEYAFVQILSGGALFGAVFMLTDPVTSPVSKNGRIIFAVGAALITMVIRFSGLYPEGTVIAIIIMNFLAPLINKLTYQFSPLNKGTKKDIIILIVSLISIIGIGLGISFLNEEIASSQNQAEMTYEKAIATSSIVEEGEGYAIVEANGFSGPLQLNIIHDGTIINAIEVVQNTDSEGYGGDIQTGHDYLEGLVGFELSEISNADTLSGVTVTTQAMLDAIGAILE